MYHTNLKFQEIILKLTDLQPIELNTLNDVVYGLLRKHILSQKFEPGERLDLTALETQLNVSRTPLKTALTRLQNEGLVDIQPRRGTFVATIDAERLEENFKIRSAFELYVSLCLFKYLEAGDAEFLDTIRIRMNELIDIAGEDWSNIIDEYIQLDQKMHEFFVMRGGPPYMLKLFQQMNVHAQLSRIVPKFRPNELMAVHFEHEQIFDAIEDYSPDQLNAALFNHLEASRIRALKVLERDADAQET